jgi:hypothetical protein
MLCSLPPIERSCLQICHEREIIPFHEFLAELKNSESGTNSREVIDGEDIYDIHTIDVLFKTLVAVYKVFDTWLVLMKTEPTV